MFPKISDLTNYITGSRIDLPFQTYGFMLVLAFISGGMVLRSELKRKERAGLLASRIRITNPSRLGSWILIIFQGILVSVILWKSAGIVMEYSRFTSNPGKFIFSLSGSIPVLILTAIIYLVLMFYRYRVLKSSRGRPVEETIHPYQNTWGILIVALVSAIVGSKLFDILDNIEVFLRDPVQSLLSFSGFAFLGGLVSTIIALILYMRVVKLDWNQVIDCSAPAILIGYAIGRMGCHLSGDGCWGVINTFAQPEWLTWLPDWTWAFRYPHNVINQGIPIPGCGGPHCRILAEPVFPTALYESLYSLFAFGLIWSLRKRIKAPVVLFGLFLVIHGTGRFLVEQIRINKQYDLFGLLLSQAEIISVVLILAGISVMLYYRRLGKNDPEPR